MLKRLDITLRGDSVTDLELLFKLTPLLSSTEVVRRILLRVSRSFDPTQFWGLLTCTVVHTTKINSSIPLLLSR